jgi:hypothetical protein
MAVNLGIIDTSILSSISIFDTYVDLKSPDNTSVTYLISKYYDPKYQGMAPIYCFTSMSSGISICALKIGQMYAFPFFNHAGTNIYYPIFCDCAKLTKKELELPTHDCNMFRFITGFIFYPFQAENSFYPLYLLIESQSVYGSAAYYALNLESFYPSFYDSSFGKSYYQYVASRESLYSFCNVTGFGTCSLLTFSIFDIDPEDWSIGNNYFQLTNGACRNTIAISKSKWFLLLFY